MERKLTTEGTIKAMHTWMIAEAKATGTQPPQINIDRIVSDAKKEAKDIIQETRTKK